MINNAVRYALYKEIDTVLISTYSTDIQDGRLEYLLSKNEEVRTGIEHPEFNIISPFQDKNFPYQTKKSVINFCKENDLDLNQTRSCYEGTEKPCYVCPACKQRDEALS